MLSIVLAVATMSARSSVVAGPGLVGPDSALKVCAAVSASFDGDNGKRSAEAAERFYRAQLAASPDDAAAKTMLARVLSQCVIAHASIWSKERLVKESNRLLSEVLARDSTSWEARYTLALNYYHAPGFFGWTDSAIRELEHLLAQQRDQHLFPEQAMPFLYLGNLYEKKGRHSDAKAVWLRGSQLFPENARLRARVSGTAP